MERRKALIASVIIAASLTTGAVALAAGSGVLSEPRDNVGNLQPTAEQPTDITVYVDPATGSVTTTAPTSDTSAATGSTRTDDRDRDQQRDAEQEGGEDDD